MILDFIYFRRDVNDLDEVARIGGWSRSQVQTVVEAFASQHGCDPTPAAIRACLVLE